MQKDTTGQINSKEKKQKRQIFVLFTVAAIAVLPILRLRLYITSDDVNKEIRVRNDVKKTDDNRSSDVHQEHKVWENTATTMRAGDVFVPGSLNLTRTETYRKCYMDPIRYEHHIFHRKQPAQLGSLEAGLLYAPIAKAGSSTAKIKMDRMFGTKRFGCLKSAERLSESAFVFTFVRDPLSRFVSCFQEAMLRWNHFQNGYTRAKIDKPPDELKQFLQRFDGIDLDEHDEMSRSFAWFVANEYDGYMVPNSHLRLQTPRIYRPKCKPVDMIYDLKEMDAVFEEFRKERGFEKEVFEDLERANVKKMHIDISEMSIETKRKICQVSAIDYCCLNFELPPECEGVVSCRWKEVTHKEADETNPSFMATSISRITSRNTSDDDLVLLIEPVSPYPPLPHDP